MKKESRLLTIDGETLMSQPLTPLNFVVDTLLSQGLHILAGSPKVGKSWLALWLAVTVAKGEAVWGMGVKQGTTLYLCLEDSTLRIQNRLFEITEDAPASVHFSTNSDTLGKGLEEQLRAFLSEHPDTVLVIIDTLQMIRGTGYDNTYANDYRDLSALKHIADAHGIAILLIHHLRKELADDVFSRISGTTAISGAVDSSFTLVEDKRGSGKAKLSCIGRDIEYRELTLERSAENVWELVSDSRTQPELLGGRIVILLSELMRDRAEFIGTPTELSAQIDPAGSEGYAVRWESTRKYITYTTPDGLKCRDNKLHEEKYCKEVMEHEFRIRAEIVSARTQAAQLPADSTAGAGTTSRSTSHESGLGANDEIHGYTVAPCGSADGSVGERQQADVAASHANAAGRSAESGAASGADDRTGWEAEREFFFSAQNQTSQTASATCQYSGIDLSADGGGSTASALVGLGHCLEQLQSAAPVMPARHYTDRKALQKEREKKIALGHKADDHEDEVSYDWQQTM